jgi:HK97 family phage portal protein
MLGRLFDRESRAITELPAWSAWGPWQGGGTTWAGMDVSPESALQLLTVYGCVRLISDSISTLPVDCFRNTPDGREPTPTPAWITHPTVDLDFESWCGQVLASLLLHGNAYIFVTKNEAGGIVELLPLDPCAVVVRRVAGRKAFFMNGRQIVGDVRHITGLMLPGSDVGMSPVEYARQSVGLGLAAQRYGSEFFTGEGNMPGVIEIPGAAQPDTMRDIAQQWRKKRTTGGRGLPGVLQGGAQWKQAGVTNEQAQFLQTRQYTAAEIAAQMFLVDPSDLGIPVAGTSLTYANLTERNLRRVQVTLLPWIIRIENALSALLYNPRFLKLNVDGLLRGDQKTRWETYQIAENINASAATRGDAPVLTTEEMRDFEDYGPAPTTTPLEVPDAAA